jgi:hypothetical protein
MKKGKYYKQETATEYSRGSCSNKLNDVMRINEVKLHYPENKK